jgi:hypothetical protein
MSETYSRIQAEVRQSMEATLVAIARGREDNGRALGGPIAQHLARETLTKHGRDWNAGCVSTCRDCGCKSNPGLMENDERGFAVCPPCMEKRK